MRRWLRLESLDRGRDVALFATRLAAGIFIVDGVWDNIVSRERMAEFVGFLRSTGFAMPEVWAPFSVYTQFAAGVLLILGLLTRLAGLTLVATFVVGIVMVHLQQSLREIWPALALVVIGVMLATHGGGKFSLDSVWKARR